MKYSRVLTVAVSLLLLPLVASAQNSPYGQPSQADMQNMMQNMQRMSECMADVDQARLEALSREAQAMSDEIERLCAAGDEAAAVAKALKFGREMNNDPTVKKMRECTRGMPQMMAQIMPVNPAEVESEAESGGICD